MTPEAFRGRPAAKSPQIFRKTQTRLRPGLLPLVVIAAILAACTETSSPGPSNPDIDPPPGPVPVITTHPVDVSATEGGSATFSVTATDAAAYRWVNNLGDTIPGDTTATLTLTNIPLTLNGTTYKCVVRNANGFATSQFAILTVSAAPGPLYPVITAQPVSSALVPGGSTLLTVAATGPGLTYQWYRGSPERPVLNGTAATLVVTRAPLPSQTDAYYCVVSNPHGVATSDTVRVRSDASRAFLLDTGAVLFAANCSGCHGAGGRGFAGAVPPLANSDFLMQNRARSIDIVLGGTSDSLLVNGLRYQGTMPAWATTFNDVQIAAVLTWIRAGLNDSTVTACNANQLDADGFATCQKTARTPQSIAADSVSYQEVYQARVILDP